MGRADKIILKKDGLYRSDWVYDKEKEEGEYVEARLDTEKGWDLLNNWGASFAIEEGVLTGDFFKLLQNMDESLLDVVEMLVNSNIKPYLKTATILNVAKSDEDELKFVEVYRTVELNNHGDLNVFDLEDYTCAHGVGKPWTHGFENDPMTDEEKIAKGCNTYALEFTPWMELKNVPLRIRPKAYFSKVVWKQGPKKRKIISNGGDEDWNFSDREPDREKWENIEVDSSMTVGEFFEGFTNEFCFFGSPEHAEEQSDVLKGRMDDVEKQIAEGKYDKKDEEGDE